LERDQAAVLTIRAATRGIIDYRKADPQDPSWWKNWRYLVRALEEESYTTLLQAALQYQLALVSNPRISTEDFTKVQREAREIFSDLEGSLKPWHWRSRADRKAKELTDFKAQWQQLAGWDLDDPEAKARWEDELNQRATSSNNQVVEQQQAEQQRQEAFNQRVEAIRKKRLKQQGRAQ
jgi:hypothetical protein